MPNTVYSFCSRCNDLLQPLELISVFLISAGCRSDSRANPGRDAAGAPAVWGEVGTPSTLSRAPARILTGPDDVSPLSKSCNDSFVAIFESVENCRLSAPAPLRLRAPPATDAG